MLAEQYPNSQHMPYPDLVVCLFIYLLIELHSWFFQGENPILFYQAANATKYIRKRIFNRLPETFPFKISKSKQLSPHMYAELTHLSAE